MGFRLNPSFMFSRVRYPGPTVLPTVLFGRSGCRGVFSLPVHLFVYLSNCFLPFAWLLCNSVCVYFVSVQYIYPPVWCLIRSSYQSSSIPAFLEFYVTACYFFCAPVYFTIHLSVSPARLLIYSQQSVSQQSVSQQSGSQQSGSQQSGSQQSVSQQSVSQQSGSQ